MVRRRFSSWPLTTLALAAAFLAGSVSPRAISPSALAAPAAALETLPGPTELSATFARVAGAIKPSVVNINTESMARTSGLERLFPFQRPEGRRSRSLGSGVVIDSAGYIVTNHHVVDGATRVQVKFLDDPKQYDARVIGSDSETDLAVIRVEGKARLAPAKFGNSDGMNVGDWVLAVGSPFGLEQSVTAGIVSAKGRDLPGSQFQSFLQTDAAINHGNSGGPLVNMAGQVVGINTLMLSQRNAWEGVGFALPSNLVAKIYNQLTKDGRVRRGSIGIDFLNAENPALLRSFGAKEGVVINNVRPGSPADKAGLRSGDVIVAIDGKPVKSGDELMDAIAGTAPGTTVRVRYFRDRKTAETGVTLADRNELYSELAGDERRAPSEEAPSGVKFGLSLAPSEGGVAIRTVEPGSFADDIGLAVGDVIVELQRQPVNSVDDVRRIQRGLKSGQDVVFKVERRAAAGGRSQTLFLAGTLP